MPPNIKQDYILIGGLALYIQKIILLGATTQKRYSDERWLGGGGGGFHSSTVNPKT